LKQLREENISPKVFDTGLAVSIFRDNSTRTRFSYASAAKFNSGLQFRIWMKQNHKLLMGKQLEKLPI